MVYFRPAARRPVVGVADQRGSGTRPAPSCIPPRASQPNNRFLPVFCPLRHPSSASWVGVGGWVAQTPPSINTCIAIQSVVQCIPINPTLSPSSPPPRLAWALHYNFPYKLQP